MDFDQPLGGSPLKQFSPKQCDALLERHSFGRLAFLEAEGKPTIIPVNYAYFEESVVIRTAPGSKLTFGPMSWMALEIDDRDPDGKWAWNVTVGGHAFDITTAIDDHSVRLRSLPIEPLVPDGKDFFMSIHVRARGGRYLGRFPLLDEIGND